MLSFITSTQSIAITHIHLFEVTCNLTLVDL